MYTCNTINYKCKTQYIPIYSICIQFIYIIYIDAIPAVLNDVWRSNDLGISWTISTSNADWLGRSYMAAVSIGGTVVVMGGRGT